MGTITEKFLRVAEQIPVLRSGNEICAEAARHIDFDIGGYFPITPSTQVFETITQMYADGELSTVCIPADGEHGAAGICLGAALGGGRVLDVSAANGLLYKYEQLPAIAGLRRPMILNIATRTVSAPLNILCDHSDIMDCLNAGWIIFMAKNPQEVYDLNIIAIRVTEHEKVRLPAMIGYDGFFTSHQKRRAMIFKNKEDVQKWIGEFKVIHSALDPRNPITLGPYMNQPDIINNKYQLHLAMEVAREVIDQVFEDYYLFSGRKYSKIETYRMEDAEAALVILNSAAETSKISVDKMREKGEKVGLVSLTVIRPFPVKEIQQAFKNVRGICVADRQDSYGALGGNMSLEIRAALQSDPENKSRVTSVVYGLGGKEFFYEEGMELLERALKVARAKTFAGPDFDYFQHTKGEPGYVPERVIEPLKPEQTKLDKPTLVAKKLTRIPHRIVPGHSACPGCGIFPSIETFMKGIEGDVVLGFHTGCAMVVTTGYPYSSHRVTYFHNLFQNGAATMSGLVEVYQKFLREGKIKEDITFIFISGDGGSDIGQGPLIGAAIRNHKFIYLEYDNQGYMNTGDQLCYTTPIGHRTSTSHVGPMEKGKTFHHKDTIQIMRGCHIPYLFTGVECKYQDLIKKARKAQKYAKEEGFVMGKLLSICPPSWGTEEKDAWKVLQAAVDCNFFPLYEIDHGITTITYFPKEVIPCSEWLKMMGKTRHLLKPENKHILDAFQKEVDRRWKQLKAMHDHPDL